MARPGGNITGFTVLQQTMAGKYLSILRELNPQLTQVALMYNLDSFPAGGASYLPAFIESAKEYHVTAITAEVHSPGEIEKTMADLDATPGSALIIFAGNFTTLHRELIISLATRLRIPAIYPYRYFADQGGLLSYGVDVLDLFRRAPDYVDRILQGAKPAELPVQAPRKFELVINLKTARAIDLVVPRIRLPRSRKTGRSLLSSRFVELSYFRAATPTRLQATRGTPQRSPAYAIGGNRRHRRRPVVKLHRR